MLYKAIDDEWFFEGKNLIYFESEEYRFIDSIQCCDRIDA
jgi:hypothetical protein